MNTQDFLFEIRTEEIPAPALLRRGWSFPRLGGLRAGGLAPASVESYATPRLAASCGPAERQRIGSRRWSASAANAFDADGKPTSRRRLREAQKGTWPTWSA